MEIRGNIWYHFDGTKWSKCSQGYLLQAQLPVKIKIMYSNSQGRFRKQQICRKSSSIRWRGGITLLIRK